MREKIDGIVLGLGFALAAIGLGFAAAATASHVQPPPGPVLCPTIALPPTFDVEADPGRARLDPGEVERFRVVVSSDENACPPTRKLEVCAKPAWEPSRVRCKARIVGAGHRGRTTLRVRAPAHKGHYRVAFTGQDHSFFGVGWGEVRFDWARLRVRGTDGG